ncbi:MAG: aminotransferase class V-fold PLP-dependent enzyme [Desulfobacteraceae bacterium]|nr:aminotransferase class V-fold PLP-dependent enzyme [Desulfobacteraceae bacterium]
MCDINRLENQARLLEPNETERSQLIDCVVSYANDYLNNIKNTPVYNHNNSKSSSIQDLPIRDEAININDAISLLRDCVDSVGINPTSGRFLGYIPGGGIFHSALGDYLAAVTNRYAGVFFASPGAVRIENSVIRWIANSIGFPEQSAGNLTSGGSIANLTAIVCARDACRFSIRELHRYAAYTTEQVHHSINKAFHVAGIGQSVLRKIPVDSCCRMDSHALSRQIASDKKAGLIPWLVVASAGTTNSGAVDPLNDIADIASANGLWFHVDGAYGGLFKLCPEAQSVLKGIERADSLVVDPHKTLFLPYGTGAVIVRDREHLFRSFSASADYMESILDDVDDINELSPADLSPELTRHFRGLRIWLPLKVLGTQPFRSALSEKIRLARYFYEKILKIEGFETGPYPDLSIVTFRYIPKSGSADKFNKRLVSSIQKNGRIFISSTRINANVVLRLAILCFRTHIAEVDEALEILTKTVKKLEASGN